MKELFLKYICKIFGHVPVSEKLPSTGSEIIYCERCGETINDN